MFFVYTIHVLTHFSLLVYFADSLLRGRYSMLGLGDIALPGLFVSFLLRFDYLKHYTGLRSYFYLSSIGYAVGMGMTYIGLIWMSSGQPALLYLVPTTLGVCTFAAWLRGDLKENVH